MTADASRYEPRLDGIRAIAVTAVVLYHAGISGFPGGYVGVDVFFVLSGYLITRLLLQEQQGTGTINFAAFYARRVRRLFPVALLMMLATLVAGWLLLDPVLGDQQHLAESTGWTLGLQANHYFFVNARSNFAGYFAQPSRELPLLHMWSLAVEEQYYLVWPALVLLLARLRSRALAIGGTALIAVISLAASVYFTGRTQDLAFFAAPLRAWELAVGALLAYGVVARIPASARAPLSLVGAAMLVYSVAFFSDSTAFPGVWALVPTLGTGALIAGTSGPAPGMVGRVLESRPFVFVGLVSYGWYVWHWPVLVFYRNAHLGELTPVVAILLALAALVVSVASYHLLEQPFRKALGARTMPPLRTIAIGGVAVLGVGVASAVLWLSARRERTHRLATDPIAQMALAAASADLHIHPSCVAENKPPMVTGCDLSRGTEVIVLYGDSHAEAWQPFVEQLARDQGLGVVTILRAGCPPAIGYGNPLATPADRSACRAHNAAVQSLLENGSMLGRKIHTVVFGTRIPQGWSYHDPPPLLREPESARARRVAMIAEGMTATAKDVLAHTDAQVMVLGPVPELRFAVANCMLQKREAWCAMSREHFEATRRSALEGMSAMTGLSPRVTLVDPVAFFCPDAACRVRRDNLVYYYDDDHPSAAAVLAYYAEWSHKQTQVLR